MVTKTDYQLAAAVCRILNRIYYEAPTESILSELTQQDILDCWPTFNRSNEAPIEQLKDSLKHESLQDVSVDYHRLFVGPGELEAYPWGSVYTEKGNYLFGETSLAFKAFCEQNQIEFTLESNQPVDHIGLILGALGVLFDNAAEHGNSLPIETLLKEHLLPWSGNFLSAIEAKAQTDYYRSFGRLTAILLDDWRELLSIEPVERKLYM